LGLRCSVRSKKIKPAVYVCWLFPWKKKSPYYLFDCNFKTSLHCLTDICCKHITFVYSFSNRVLLLFKQSMPVISIICLDFHFTQFIKFFTAQSLTKEQFNFISLYQTLLYSCEVHFNFSPVRLTLTYFIRIN
jgi:hypothetical protein